MIKENKGITIIALIITIIVMLILVGVSIVTPIGDGLFGKTKEAKDETEKLALKEKLEVAVLSSDIGGEVDFELLKQNLDSISDLTYVTENPTSLPVRIKIKDQEYKIKEDGSIITGIDAEDIRNNPQTYYGKYVTNYNSSYDAGIADAEGQLGKWQIFLADEENIYLIASNWISTDYTKQKGEGPHAIGFDYDEENKNIMWFRNIINKYLITEEAIPEVLSKFDNRTREKYHKWMNNTENQLKNSGNTSRGNSKAVASMLDIELWDGYTNTTYAKYAIGGPTLEMFCESYNATHTIQLKAKEEYNYGYMIQKDDEADSEHALKLLENKGFDEMYFKNYIWLSSPMFDPYCVGNVNGNKIGYTSFNNKGFGFRPLVSLKSNVHLVENKNGDNITYSLELD